MDADDVALPIGSPGRSGTSAEHPECVMVGSRVTVIDPDGRP